MNATLLRSLLVLTFGVLACAPIALGCSTCNTYETSTTYQGEIYTYMTGGCGNPPNNSWGYYDCHTTSYVIEGTPLQATLSCDTGISQCYYTEVDGGGGSGGGGPDNNGDGEGGGGAGSCSRSANGGACPAYCSSCSP